MLLPTFVSDRGWMLAITVLSVYLVGKLMTYWKLRQFKGPRWAAWSDWPHSMAMLRGNCHEWYAEASEKYGVIARVAPNILVTSSPEVWAHVNKHPEYKRSDWYYHATRIEHRRDNIFSQTDNVKHEKRRKQMMPGYSGRENFELETDVDRCVQELLDLIRTKYASTSEKIVPLDMAKKIQFFTLDVISSIGLGAPFGMLRKDTDVDGYLESSADGLAIGNVALALGISWLPQLPILGRFFAPSAKDKNGFGRMIATCFRLVDTRAASSTDSRSDMLASFIRHGLSGDELRSEALEQILAGSDTTAGALRGALLHIMTNPRVCSKLQQEIDEAVRLGKAPAKDQGIVSASQVKQLPYLRAVIRECLRIRPSVANIFSRDVPKNGDVVEVGGKHIFLPGGCYIGSSAYAMHHSQEIYGEDAKQFRPERWFEQDSKKLARMVRTNDLIFSSGKWRCLGESIAQMELGKIVFELFRHFDLAPLDPARPWDSVNHLGLFAISNMWVQVMERT